MATWRRKTIGLSVLCLACQSSLKGSCILKWKVSWKISYRNYFQDSETIMAPNTLDKGGFVCGIFMDYQTYLTQ